MNEEITADHVIDAIAAIELQRQELHVQSDPEAWRRMALEKLEEIGRQLEEELRLHGPDAERSAAAQAVRVEIGRVKGHAGATRQQPNSRPRQSGQPSPQRRDARRHAGARRGGRPMGRRGGG